MKAANIFSEHPALRVVFAALLAFLFALFATFLYLSVQMGGAFDWGVSDTASTREKLRILASLAASTTPGEEEKAEILRNISSGSGNTPSEEVKTELLESLRERP